MPRGVRQHPLRHAMPTKPHSCPLILLYFSCALPLEDMLHFQWALVMLSPYHRGEEKATDESWNSNGYLFGCVGVGRPALVVNPRHYVCLRTRARDPHSHPESIVHASRFTLHHASLCSYDRISITYLINSAPRQRCGRGG